MADERAEAGRLMMELVRSRSNWQRWGADDQKGAANLITPAKRVAAAKLVREGRVVSLGRELSWLPTPAEPNPPQHRIGVFAKGDELQATSDYIALESHGFSVTHLDALGHLSSVEDGGWGGVPADQVVADGRAVYGHLGHWAAELVTRGVLLDIARLRGVEHIVVGEPIMAVELEAAEAAEGVRLEPGDALVLHGGRDRWTRANPEYTKDQPRPGLHPSCLEFLRDRDVSILCWDFHEASPNGTDIGLSVHLSLTYFGVALIDNSSFDEVVAVCDELSRWEFMFVAAPLRAPGATGSPVNPLAIF